MKLATLVAATASAIALQPVAAHAADGAALAAQYHCTACHADASKLVGPSYKDVAKKYAGDTAAPAKLAAKIKAGGSGVWGSIPMPPNNVPDADLKDLVAYILAKA